MADPVSTLAGIRRRLTDLQTFQLPRLSSCAGPLDLHRELAEEMRGDMEGVRQSIDLAREIAEGRPRSDEREEILERCDLLESELASLRISYRRGLLDSKRQIASRARSRRHELRTLSSSTIPQSEAEVIEQKNQATSRPTDMGGDDALQSKTNAVTDALRRTTTLMQAELERSVLSVQMLDQSTSTLRLTQTLYDTYTSLLTTSSRIIKSLERADAWDRALILAALILFLLCCGWVIKRRVLDRVVGGLGWWVSASGKLVGLGLGNTLSKQTRYSHRQAIPAPIPVQKEEARKHEVIGHRDSQVGKKEIKVGGILDEVVPPITLPELSDSAVVHVEESQDQPHVDIVVDDEPIIRARDEL
ncbi:Sec20-domain-containing protein [Naematelia encephala]|uniref:Sec20-domain-containing protein n=1 Tax=Naematelia encephala TaxID=71784 RepID=A0A1Y2BLS5_9TREE|nr:Sec20-domain-containing protein [Naematelia encephala]